MKMKGLKSSPLYIKSNQSLVQQYKCTKSCAFPSAYKMLRLLFTQQELQIKKTCTKQKA